MLARQRSFSLSLERSTFRLFVSPAAVAKSNTNFLSDLSLEKREKEKKSLTVFASKDRRKEKDFLRKNKIIQWIAGCYTVIALSPAVLSVPLFLDRDRVSLFSNSQCPLRSKERDGARTDRKQTRANRIKSGRKNWSLPRQTTSKHSQASLRARRTTTKPVGIQRGDRKLTSCREMTPLKVKTRTKAGERMVEGNNGFLCPRNDSTKTRIQMLSPPKRRR